MHHRPLLSFLRRPAFTSSAPARLTSWEWLGWLGLLIVVAVIGGALDTLVERTFHWAVPAHSVWMAFLRHPSWVVVTVLLPAPALEELGFRAFLSSAPGFVFTGLAFFPAYVYAFIRNNLIGVPTPTSPAAALSGYLHAFWIVLAAGAISLLLHRYRGAAVVEFFRRRAAWIFWISCAAFGAEHAFLYTNGSAWWGFVLVMPQFLAGVGLAYIRVSYGLRWSIASHYAFDALAVLPSWLYLSAVPHGPLYGVLMAVMVALLGIMAYGLVVLGRVARLRW
jgi:hypothetical protein